MEVFTYKLQIRITKRQLKQLKKIRKKNKKKYRNISHLVRCAMIKLIREELGGTKDDHAKIIRYEPKRQ